MMLFLRLAARNVFRNRIRTLISLSAIACGAAALIINAGIVFNIFRELREDAIHGRHGHLQIYRQGHADHHLEDTESRLMTAADTRRVLDLARSNGRVLHATQRREFSGLISNGERRAAFLGVAVDPLDDAIFSAHAVLRDGAPLSPSRPYGVLAGLGLAAKLDARPGDVLVLMTTTASGTINAIHVTLQGVFEGGLKEYDDWTLKVPLAAAAQLLIDDRSEQIVLLLKRTEDVAVTRAQLEAAFRDAGLTLETRSWRELALFHGQVVDLFGRELDIIRLIIATIVILGIGNAIGMSIMERNVELATLRALGLRGRAIVALLTTEAFLTAVLGAFFGVLGGVIVARIVSHIGIVYPSPPGSTRPFLGGIDLDAANMLEAFVICVTASLLAAVLPIWRAIRRPIAPTLRHV